MNGTLQTSAHKIRKITCRQESIHLPLHFFSWGTKTRQNFDDEMIAILKCSFNLLYHTLITNNNINSFINTHIHNIPKH